jgi:hypothetical protein
MTDMSLECVQRRSSLLNTALISPLRSSLDNLNRLILRGVVPVGENTEKEVNTMAKRTIIKWWIWGLVVMAVGGILALAGSLAMVAHVQNVTTGGRYSFNSNDNFFWTMIGLMALGGIVASCGYIAQLVAQIGALFNTHRLADKTWFRFLLWGTIVGYVVAFVTLGLQLGFAFSGSVATAFVWPGFAVGALIEWIVMICYLAAGPDGMAVQQPEKATPAAPPKTLVPTG